MYAKSQNFFLLCHSKLIFFCLVEMGPTEKKLDFKCIFTSGLPEMGTESSKTYEQQAFTKMINIC